MLFSKMLDDIIHTQSFSKTHYKQCINFYFYPRNLLWGLDTCIQLRVTKDTLNKCTSKQTKNNSDVFPTHTYAHTLFCSCLSIAYISEWHYKLSSYISQKSRSHSSFPSIFDSAPVPLTFTSKMFLESNHFPLFLLVIL